MFQDIWLFLTCTLMKVPVMEVKLRVFKSRYLWCRQTTTFYSLAYFLSPLPAPKYLLRPHFPESIIRMPLFQTRPEAEWTHSDLVSSATVLSFYCSLESGPHLHRQPQPPMPPPPLPLSLPLAPGLSPGGAELGQIPPYVHLQNIFVQMKSCWNKYWLQT